MARKSAGLGDRHLKIMKFLIDFQGENGYSPSIREIGEKIGVKSTSLVDYYLKQLEEQNYISRDDHISRSIRIVRPLPSLVDKMRKVTEVINDVLRIPILGRIVAGAPIPVPSSSVGYFDSESAIEIAQSLLPARDKASDLFALEVQGESMIDAMVDDGDIVVMRPTSEARNGEMVAIWLDSKDETTLKYFYKENNRVRLQPANPTMEPIYINDPDKAGLRILGKVVMVVRQVKEL